MINLRDYARGDDVTDVSEGISQALQAAAATGEMLYWPDDSGAYMCGSPVSLPSNVTILAEAGATIKALAGNDNEVLLFGAFKERNIKIIGLTIDGNLAQIGNNNPVVQFYTKCHDVTIEGCTFQNTRGIALNLSTAIVNFRIHNNRFFNTGAPAMPVDSTTIALTEEEAGRSRSIIISDNIFDQVGLGCVSFSNTWDVVFSGNISRFSNSGLLYVAPGDCRHFAIVGNYVTTGPETSEPYALGFDLVNLFESSIVGNISIGNTSGGIGLFNCQDITVVGNICKNNHSQPNAPFNSGIYIRNDLGTAARITLSGNICGDTQTPKTQGYGLLYDPSIPDLVIDESNVFAGNAIAEIGLVGLDPFAVLSTDTIRRAKFRRISVTWTIPANTPSLGTAINDQPFPDLDWNDTVVVTPSGYYGIVVAQVVTPGTVRLLYCNVLGTAQSPPEQIFQITAIKVT
jgi:Pectate lyase superfamily protein